MTIDTPALKLRKYSFSGTLSDRIFYSDKFQKELYHRLQIDYAKICEGKKYVEPHHKNLDLCCISGGLISYGKLDLIKEFISNHPLYNINIEESRWIDEYTSRGYLYILLDSVIRLFPVSSEIKENTLIVKIREFYSWINNNLSNLEWNEKEGRYIFHT